MDCNKLLTVVVPAYNMHDYLRRCLDSLCVEDVMNDVQVIVVNDGSTDDTSQIAHEYEVRFPRYFQVIDKENGNYGSCMNVALPLSQGKYFRTLDADDWYDIEAFVHFVEDLHFTDADIVISEKCNHYVNCREEIRRYSFPAGLPLCQDISFNMINWDDPFLKEMMGVMFVTTKTSLLRNVDMHWSEGVFYSDFEYITIPLLISQTVRLSPFPVYQYLLGREGQSVAYTFSTHNKYSYMIVLNSILDRLEHSHFLSQGAAALFMLKLALLVRVIYNLFFHVQFFLDSDLLAIESRICQVSSLRTMTESLAGFRGHRYIYAYRHNRPLFYLYCLDYRLRTNTCLRKLLKKD